jgi:16S rRNA (guanine527-N7)-methyltransferase
VESASIAELLKAYAALSAAQVEQVSVYVDILLKWNARINLTAVRDPAEIVVRHFGESFFAAERLAQTMQPMTVIDLGSGAGFPGLPFAIFAPWAQVTLVESNRKKATFLSEVISALKLGNAKVFAERAESHPGKVDLVTMRAVERFTDALPLALKLVQPGGRIAVMIGPSQIEVARALAADVRWQQPLPIPGGHSRVLAVGTKSVIVEQ